MRCATVAFDLKHFNLTHEDASYMCFTEMIMILVQGGVKLITRVGAHTT